ncbi:unnamed protein product [Sphagnum jensenii]|uniref:Secreted protein n=1 Tax=Sphagnum jensenii TaxID=128206 RepID=A0ABP0WL83_9BRYO
MGCLRAGAVLVVLEVVVILQACQDCMGLRQILSAGHSTSHGGSSIYSREESTQSPHQYETSPANLPDKGLENTVGTQRPSRFTLVKGLQH